MWHKRKNNHKITQQSRHRTAHTLHSDQNSGPSVPQQHLRAGTQTAQTKSLHRRTACLRVGIVVKTNDEYIN